ncbi:MAG: lytic transglycosylase domain-containing protein [Desulforhopalus sp.]
MAGTRNDILLDSEPSPVRPFAIDHGWSTIFSRGRLHATCPICPTCVMVTQYVVLAVYFLLFTASTLQASMYLCRDRSGAMNFTNVQNGADCKPFVLEKKNGTWANMIRHVRGTDPARYDGEIRKIATRYNVDPSLIKAIIHTESDFDYKAVSRCGAQGLMQLMPETARELQVANPFDPWENIDGGTRYFRSLLDSFDEDLVLSLAAYNAGPGAVTRTGGVPEFPETQHYIKKVLKQYKVYKATW